MQTAFRGIFYSKFSPSTLPDGRQAICRKVCLNLPCVSLVGYAS